MEDRDIKTRDSHVDGTENQPTLTDGQTAGGDPALTGPVSPASESGSNADWGFAKSDEGMATETKIGLALIVILLVAFAFVVYRKVDLRNQMAAAVEDAAGSESKSLQPADGGDRKDPVPQLSGSEPGFDPNLAQSEPPAAEEWSSFDSSSGSSTVQPAVATGGRAVVDAGRPFEDEELFGESNEVIPTAAQEPQPTDPPAQGPPSQPAESTEDLFDPFEEPAEAQAGATGGAPATAASQDSGFPPDEFQPAAPAATATAESEPFDPFAESSSERSTPKDEPFPQTAETKAAISNDEPFDPFSEQPIQRSAQTSQSAAEPAEQGSAGAPDPLGFEDPVPTGAAAARPAPFNETNAGNPFGPSEQPQRLQPTAGAADPGIEIGFSPVDETAPQPFGETESIPARKLPNPSQPSVPASGPLKIYEVRNGDNYWTISRKMYGTSKYFLALDRANRSRISDPTRMRPGMKVLIPTTDELERNNPDLFKPRAQTAAYRGSQETEPAGFFLSADGQPMYRIGKSDTLSTIALRHLGRSSRWIQIYELNRKTLKSPNDLRIGATLVLPADASRVRVID